MDSTSTSGQAVTGGSLLPAARVDWLLENGRGRDHLTVTSILLWLQFNVLNTASALQQIQSEVQLGVQKYREDSLGNLAPQALAPYTQPATPSAVTSWTNAGQDEQDGLDPYLWTHCLFPPQFTGGFTNQATSAIGVGGMGQYNIDGSPSGTQPAQLIYPSGRVTAAWQPDVIIRTKRRMVKGEGLAMYLSLPQAGLGNQVEYNLTYRARVLTT